jgi:hypothetical protein
VLEEGAEEGQQARFFFTDLVRALLLLALVLHLAVVEPFPNNSENDINHERCRQDYADKEQVGEGVAQEAHASQVHELAFPQRVRLVDGD